MLILGLLLLSAVGISVEMLILGLLLLSAVGISVEMLILGLLLLSTVGSPLKMLILGLALLSLTEDGDSVGADDDIVLGTCVTTMLGTFVGSLLSSSTSKEGANDGTDTVIVGIDDLADFLLSFILILVGAGVRIDEGTDSAVTSSGSEACLYLIILYGP